MTWDLRDYRIVTASAYPGMMAPLTEHPSCVCVMSGDSDPAAPPDRARLSLEATDGVRRRWRFGDVSRLADLVPAALAGLPADDRPLLVVPPRSSERWLAAAASWPVAARVAGARTVVGDKIWVREALSDLGVPVPDALVLDRDDLAHDRVAARLGSPYVLQMPDGAGGRGTFLVSDASDLAAATDAHPDVPRWLASRYAGATTVNVAGVVHHDGVRMFPPSLQAAGIPEMGAGFGAYCGSWFGGLDISHRARRAVVRNGAAIGGWLRRIGHLGLFGVDVAVDGDAIAVLEVNPRVQGSSWLLGSLQAGEACLTQHVRSLLGAPLSPGGRVIAHGGHLLVRWSGRPGVVRTVPDTAALPVGGGRVAVVSGLPAPGVTLVPGAILARLASDAPLTTGDGRSLTPGAAAALAGLRAGVAVAVREPV